jgi:hypothetical protein
MRIGIIVLLSFVLTTLTARADETLPALKVGSETYSNVTVVEVTPTDVLFKSEEGMANAKLRMLGAPMQQHFHYNAATADAAERKLKSLHIQTPFPATQQTINRFNAKIILDGAISRAKTIINQPVREFVRTSAVHVATFKTGWFHPGAIKPDFDHVDIRTGQETSYSQYTYVNSDLNPGVFFLGSELEFNAMTKYFYADRSLPKKKLTEAEMLEINRLYRIIGDCQALLNSSQNEGLQ